ncbi:hypothetical protein BDQ12DRAFT_688047 [Crucibulum laeve]|uniref:Uncharacterized protein n=1 Tax=Crucibulum laeve TaxID=68775 RepID=A0A5C3LS57_9AGAR|nr:hypothetical protein BDQ12DRAFT_688047 [Crucibulum laeve]
MEECFSFTRRDTSSSINPLFPLLLSFSYPPIPTSLVEVGDAASAGTGVKSLLVAVLFSFLLVVVGFFLHYTSFEPPAEELTFLIN